ncbi:MAG: hypothetical protein ABS34_02420 [Opitutaceae bacterium BACL24 MAG-120322-bin51]|nr:MAG: hypothetical protein ABS34_02420 [Opitutaceae bacterium BACL24 MAG-120322-bin51]
MSEKLSELRAQRDLIQTHLTWLDAQIARAEGSAMQHAASPDQPPAVPCAAAPTPTTVEAPAVVAAQHSASHDPTIPTVSVFKIDEERHLTSTTSDVRRAQIGCFLFFVGGALLFLFFLFGLPHLVD